MVEVEEVGGLTRVYAISGNHKIEICVFHPRKEFGQLQPAKINWPCCGSQPPETTKTFIEALKKAAEIAEKLNGKAVGQ